ncbi:MAG: hypothetical protein Q9178_008002 [Gyalolechia marmorata]
MENREMDDAEDELSINDHSLSTCSKGGIYASVVLHLAVRHNACDLADYSLDHGADFNSIFRGDSGYESLCSFTSLERAIDNDCVDMAKLLVKRGADIEGRPWAKPLHMAVARGSSDVVSFLLSSGANIEARDDGEQTPLVYAAGEGSLEGVKSLLGFGAAVDARGYSGLTPLMHANKSKDLEMVQLLLKSGAAVEAGDNTGITPLMCATIKGRLDITLVEYLLRRGASSAESFDGTPLHKVLLAKYITNYFSVVQTLLEYGADINVRRLSDGMTPVYVEALGLRRERFKDVEVLRLLCNYGADPYLIDNESKTAFDYLEGHEGGISVLRSSYRSQLPQLE